jgi:hypothetical protein
VDESTRKISAVALEIILLLAALAFIIPTIIIRSRSSFEEIDKSHFLASKVQTEEGEFLVLTYDGLPDEGVEITKIRGEDLKVRVWKSDGTWEDHVFSGEVGPYDRLTLALPEDENGYDVYYKNQKIASGYVK